MRLGTGMDFKKDGENYTKPSTSKRHLHEESSDLKHIPNGEKNMAFLQSFTYMKTNLDIFTDYSIYKGKQTNGSYWINGKCPEKYQVIWQKKTFFFLIVTKETRNVF